MDIEKTIRALTGRGFAVQHFATGREAADYLDGAIDGTTVGIGGSMTAKAMKLEDRRRVFDNLLYTKSTRGRTYSFRQ